MGFARLIKPGSVLQCMIGLLVALSYHSIVMMQRPYRERSNNFIAAAFGFSQVCFFTALVMVKVGFTTQPHTLQGPHLGISRPAHHLTLGPTPQSVHALLQFGTLSESVFDRLSGNFKYIFSVDIEANVVVLSVALTFGLLAFVLTLLGEVYEERSRWMLLSRKDLLTLHSAERDQAHQPSERARLNSLGKVIQIHCGAENSPPITADSSLKRGAAASVSDASDSSRRMSRVSVIRRLAS